MPVYSYQASDASARTLAGTLIAETPAEGRQTLRERGLRVLNFRPARMRTRSSGVRFHSRHRRREQVAEMARYLALLLRAGVPLSQALEVLARQCDRRMTVIVKDVQQRIDGGVALAEALNEHREWFDALFISAVRVGELSGNLEDALTELAAHLRAQQSLRSQLTAVLTYPLILLCIGIGVMIFLMSYVVPQLLAVLIASGRPLPGSTVLLKGFSDLLVRRWLLLLGAAVSLFVTITIALRKEKIRRAWQSVQLYVPVLSPLLRKTIVASFAQQMALLLKTGIPFVDAVRSVANQTNNLLLRDELNSIGRAVEAGGNIAPNMENSRIFPPVVAHLVAVGQDSGELPSMLSELKSRYETEVQLAMARFTAALEPLLIVILASGVGFVVFACLMPILEATRGMAQ